MKNNGFNKFVKETSKMVNSFLLAIMMMRLQKRVHAYFILYFQKKNSNLMMIFLKSSNVLVIIF